MCCWNHLLIPPELKRNARRKSSMEITQVGYILFWTNPRRSIPTATYLPSHKPSQLNEQDMQGTPGESKDEHTSDVLPWTPTHGHTSIDRPVKIYIHQYYADTWCCLEDLPRVKDWRWIERVEGICALIMLMMMINFKWLWYFRRLNANGLLSKPSSKPDREYQAG